MQEFDWIPLKRVGRIEFGCPVDEAIRVLGLVAVPENFVPSVGWIDYTIPGVDIYIYAENDRICQVACNEKCLFQGQNLIGMEIGDAIELVGVAADKDPDPIEIDDEPQYSYQLDAVAGQLFSRNGRVVRVCCGPSYED